MEEFKVDVSNLSNLKKAEVVETILSTYNIENRVFGSMRFLNFIVKNRNNLITVFYRVVFDKKSQEEVSIDYILSNKKTKIIDLI